MRSRVAAFLLLCALCAVLGGCLDVEQSLTLDRRLAGRAGLTMKMNLEPVVATMARFQRAMEGKSGAPSADEIEAVRREIRSSGGTMSEADFAADRAAIEGTLPAGVTLADASFKGDGLTLAARLVFAFDDVAKLAKIKLPKGSSAGAGPDLGNPVEAPFEAIKVVDEGDTVLVTVGVDNPLAGQKAQAGQMSLDADAMKELQGLFEGLRVAFRITAPFAVVDSTAHRRDGDTLVWEYDFKALERQSAEELAKAIRVRYRKQ